MVTRTRGCECVATACHTHKREPFLAWFSGAQKNKKQPVYHPDIYVPMFCSCPEKAACVCPFPRI